MSYYTVALDPLLYGQYLIAPKDKEALRERIKAVRYVLKKAKMLINEGKSSDESPEVEWGGV